MLKKRLLSIFMVLALVIGLMPSLSFTAWASDGIPYIYYTVDGTKAICHDDGVCTNYEIVTSETTSLGKDKWYVVKDDVTVKNRIYVSGNTNLILANGAVLTAERGISVDTVGTLNIYAQSENIPEMGSIIATGSRWQAGIGGAQDQKCGRVNIHGGNVSAESGAFAAGIGGGEKGDGGRITIYSGNVYASGDCGAGIGAGSGDPGWYEGGYLTVYGGIVSAEAINGGAGIGGGLTAGYGADVAIYGGSVTAQCIHGDAAGIGCGEGVDGGGNKHHGKLVLGDGISFKAGNDENHVTVTGDNSNATTALGKQYFKSGHTGNHTFTSKASGKTASEATCTKAATYYVQCDNCDAVSDTQTVSIGKELGHSFTTKASSRLKSAANCQSAAVYYVQCDRCDAVDETRSVSVGEPSYIHTYTTKSSSRWAAPGTCTEAPKYFVQCDYCDDVSTTETISVGQPEGHSFTMNSNILASYPTCTEPLKAYAMCGKCGTVSYEVTVPEGGPLGHEWGEWTSVSDTKHQRICGRDNTHTQTADHNWVDVEVKTAATHMTEGEMICSCKDCGKMSTRTIEKLENHTFNKKVADEKYLKSPATCKGAAVYYKSCECGEAGSDDTFTNGEALPHTLSKTYEQYSEMQHKRTCTVCSAIVYEEHNYVKGLCACGAKIMILEDVAPDIAGKWISKTSPKNYYEITYDEATDTATFTFFWVNNEGEVIDSWDYTDSIKTISIDNDRIILDYFDAGFDQGAGISFHEVFEGNILKETDGAGYSGVYERKEPVNVHTYGNPTYNWNGQECTATRVCSVCAEGTKGHSESETVTGAYVKDTDAVCTKAETGHYEAEFTNDAFATQKTAKDSVSNGEALGHKWGNWTSVGDKQHQRVCENDATHKETVDHTWNNGEVTKAATHMAEGEKTFNCTACNAVRTETIEKDKEHIFNQKSTDEKYLKSPATCTAPAVYFTSCECGEKGNMLFDSGEALGHKWKDANCTTPKTCTVCKATEGEALGHKWKDANCTTPKTCTVCEATEGEALGHDWSEWTSISDTEHQRVCENDPAHMETGEHEFTRNTCEVCGYQKSGGSDAVIYTLKFNVNGGSAIESISGRSGKIVDLDDYVTERDGYVFAGWYSDSELTDAVSEIKLTRSMTVYAKWDKKNSDSHECNLPFTDTKSGDWSHFDIHYVYENGMMNGVSETLFAPKLTTSRAMIVTILYRLEGEPAFMNDNIFTDVEADSWYEKAVVWANGKGIVNGYSDEKFGPNDSITREQLAAILYRYAEYKEMDVSVDDGTNYLDYNDIMDISEYATSAMVWAVDRGLIKGDDGNLNPAGNATREQAAAILHRFCE